MAVKMDKFLLQYFMQLHFNEMPSEKFSTFVKYIENGDDFTAKSDMKEWKKNLVHQVGDKWEKNELPNGIAATPPATNPWEMSDDEWEKLYIEFRDAFRRMATNKSKFADPSNPDTYNRDAANFLSDYYGNPANKIFSTVVATPTAEARIADLLTLLKSKRSILEDKLKAVSIINSEFKYDDLVKGIEGKKHNDDPEFQPKLIEVADYITRMTTDPYWKADDPQLSDPTIGIGEHDFTEIKNGFDAKRVDPNQLDKFKASHQDLLRIVAKNKKIQEQFKSTKISDAMDEAKKKTAFEDTNSPNYLVDNEHDKLTPLQKLKEWKADTYKNVFEKYKLLQGDRLYYSPQAANIVEALDGAGIKPTDGLTGITKAAGKIKKALLEKSASAAGHFEWLNKTLEHIEKVMPNAYEGALRKGPLLHAVIEELIVCAVRDGKIEEAKSAMEVISVCKYGLTTSKIMDKLSKEEVTIFSDPKLSFNNNEFTKVFGAAMDKTIGTMLKLSGYAITAVGNTINKTRSQFKGHRGKRIQSEVDAWEAQNNADKSAAIHERDTLNAADKVVRDAEQLKLDTLDRTWGINASNIDRHKLQLERSRQTEEQRKTDRDNAEQRLNAAQQIVDEYDQLGTDITNLTNEINALNGEVTTINTEISSLDAQLTAIPTPYTNAMEELKARQLQSKLEAKQEELKQKQDEITAKTDERTTKQADRTARSAAAGRARRSLPGLQGTFNTNNVLWQSIQGRNDRQESRIQDFENARDRVRELTEQIDRREQVVADWDANHIDMHDELIQFWDFIETGRDGRTGPFYNRFRLSKRKAQKNLDAKKISMFQQYQRDYGAMAT